VADRIVRGNMRVHFPFELFESPDQNILGIDQVAYLFVQGPLAGQPSLTVPVSRDVAEQGLQDHGRFFQLVDDDRNLLHESIRFQAGHSIQNRECPESCS
jgi:hypothetical protein